MGFPLARIHSLAAIKALNCSTKAAHRPGLFPPASNIINTTPGVPERLRRVDGRIRVKWGVDAGVEVRTKKSFVVHHELTRFFLFFFLFFNEISAKRSTCHENTKTETLRLVMETLFSLPLNHFGQLIFSHLPSKSP